MSLVHPLSRFLISDNVGMGQFHYQLLLSLYVDSHRVLSLYDSSFLW